MTQTCKSLFAVVNSRNRQESWANIVRSTWLPQVDKTKADALFFVGRGDKTVPADTIELDCDDSYAGLPEKIRAIARWAKEHDYAYVMKVDDDVILKPNAVLSSGYDQFAYCGRANRKPNNEDPFWVPMGFAYWMRKDVLDFIVNAPLPVNNDDERWVAQHLYAHGVELQNDSRYHLYTGGLLDLPPRPNRPLRRGKYLQNISSFAEGIGWCIFFETGGGPQRIPVEEKMKEFMNVFREFGEKTPT